MNHVIRQALLWVTLYMVLALLPVSWLLVSPPAPRSALAEAGVLLGALALSIMALQALISAVMALVTAQGSTTYCSFIASWGSVPCCWCWRIPR